MLKPREELTTPRAASETITMGASLNKFDTIIEMPLIILLAFMPLVGGARKAWSEEVVIILSNIIIVCFLLKLICHYDYGIIWTWAYVPIIAFLLIATVQLISLPRWLIGVVSPNTLRLKADLLGDLPNAEAILKSMPFSFYPNATKHDLRLVLSIVGVFTVALNVFRHPGQVKRLLVAIALIGGIVALIALAQDTFGNGKIYWFAYNPHAKALSGPFINHNHYGHFINLSTGAAIGWFCIKLQEILKAGKTTTLTGFKHFSLRSTKPLWPIFAIISLNVGTVFISGTRGGVISMLIAAAFIIICLAWQEDLGNHGWIIVATALVAFITILLTDFNAVYDRLSTLQNLGGYKYRWQTLKDLTVVFACFPLLGTGLGTHSVVYPMFQNIYTTALFTHAENEYAQAMEEVGLTGLVSLIIFGMIVWANYAKNIRTKHSPIYIASYGLGFGLLAILIHSFSDYGQHIPSNVFLSTIFCALLLSLARQAKETTGNHQIIRGFCNARWLRIVVFLIVSSILTWSFLGARNARIAEGYWNNALEIEHGLLSKKWQGTEAEYEDLISHAMAASCYQPENIHYRYYLNLYRWYSITKTKNPDIEKITLPEEQIPFVRNILDEFNEATTFCPTYGPPYAMAGQIEKFTLYNNAGAKKIRKGFRLAPCDPVICLVSAQLDIAEGRIDESIEKFNRAVKIDRDLFWEVVHIYITHISRPHLAIPIAGDEIDRLLYVANALEEMQYLDLAGQARGKAKELLEEKCSQTTAPGWMFAFLANIYRKEHNNEAAVEYYRRALSLDYGRIDCRFSLAELLTEMGRASEAIEELKICLRLRPQFKAAENLIKDLSIHPKILEEKRQ